MAQSDPTDHALAVIASILDHKEQPETGPENDTESEFLFQPLPAEEPAPETAPAPEPVDLSNYTRHGPGPLDALRFRWSARRDDAGDYYVDETIGLGSRPLSSGPMPEGEVVHFIDERERVARQRFEALRQEMRVGARAPDRGPDRDDGED